MAVATAPPDAPLTGEESVSRFRLNSTISFGDGQLRLVYFKARRTETINNVTMACTTAAGATPTLIRVGVWSATVSAGLPTGDLSALVANTASDTTLLAAVQEYTKALASPWAKVAGLWYAAGLLVKTGASSPSISNFAATSAFPMAGGSGRPRLAGLLPSQTNLPSTVAVGSLTTTAICPYFLFTP